MTGPRPATALAGQRPRAVAVAFAARAALAGACLLAAMTSVSCGTGGPAGGASMTVPVHRSAWDFSGIVGVELASEHYRIYTTTNNRALLNYLPGFLESAREHYLALTGLGEPARPALPMPVYLLANRQQWAIMTRRVTAPRSELFLSVESGGYCYRGVCVLWDLGYFGTFSIAAHEGMHQFLYHRLRDPLPSWAEEGLCVLAEGFDLTGPAQAAASGASVRFAPRRNTLRTTNLRNAISGGRWEDLESLLSGDAAERISGSPVTAPEYYGRLWALLMFIRSEQRTRAGLERMLADAGAGRLRRVLNVPARMGAGRTYSRAVAVPVFKHYIDPDLKEFQKRFRAFAKKLAKVE